MIALLRVTAPHFVATAVWEKKAGQWTCIEAAPILRWMVGKSPVSTEAYLVKRGYQWEWVGPTT